MSKMSAIVVAAGQGSRFGGDENKVFAQVEGQPLFLRALQLFINREDVAQTILVASPADMNTFKSKYAANIGFMGVKLVEGGPRRQDSVANGLAAVADDAEYVAIHDAVRPCLIADWIDAVFTEARNTGAAVPACRIAATIKRASDQRIVEETVSRENLWLAQTPQIFRRDVIVNAYKALPADADVTDDAQVVELAGTAVTLVESDPRNIKITTKGDLSLAGAIIRSLPQPKRGGTFGAFEEAKW